MGVPCFYRYFVGCRPGPELRRLLGAIGGEVGQQVRLDLLHLTLCVIAEATERDRFLLSRVRAAFAGQVLSSFQVRLGRVRSGRHGATIGGLGRQNEIQDFYTRLTRMLATRSIAPLHRQSGLKAHITLGYDPCRIDSVKRPIEWFPDELLLIESEVGMTRHNVMGHWPLLPPSQGSLPFTAPLSSRPSLELRLAS